MKTIPTGMQADLDNGVTTHCLCWKLTRKDSVVMGFTNHDKDLTFASTTYDAATGLDASSISQAINLTPADMDSIGAISSDSITEVDIALGKYDNAAVSVYLVDWADVTKRTEIFTGYLGNVARDKNAFKAEVRSLVSALGQQQGQLYQRLCSVNLFSAKCGKLVTDDAAYRINGTVTKVFSNRAFATTTAGIITESAGWFTGGLLEWTSGDNDNVQIEIKSHTKQGGGIEAWLDLWDTMLYDIQVGDTFIAQVGCDKTITTCKAKFNNVLNFRGLPRIPGNDAIITWASKKDRNDGTSWYE